MSSKPAFCHVSFLLRTHSRHQRWLHFACGYDGFTAFLRATLAFVIWLTSIDMWASFVLQTAI